MVAQLGAIFASDRYIEIGEVLRCPSNRPTPPAPARRNCCRAAPAYLFANARNAVIALAQRARRRLVVATPHFVPDDATSTRAGDRRAVRDRGAADPLAQQQPAPDLMGADSPDALLEAGIKVAPHRPRFLHAKHPSVDDEIALGPDQPRHPLVRAERRTGPALLRPGGGGATAADRGALPSPMPSTSMPPPGASARTYGAACRGSPGSPIVPVARCRAIALQRDRARAFDHTFARGIATGNARTMMAGWPDAGGAGLPACCHRGLGWVSATRASAKACAGALRCTRWRWRCTARRGRSTARSAPRRAPAWASCRSTRADPAAVVRLADHRAAGADPPAATASCRSPTSSRATAARGGLAAMVAVIATIAAMPYFALQFKAVWR